MQNEAVQDNEILIRRDGSLGHILLNRPRAMNALTHGMVNTIAATLQSGRRTTTSRLFCCQARASGVCVPAGTS